MRRVYLLAVATTACSLLWAIPLSAADSATAKLNSKVTKTTKRATWRPEALSGKLAMVEPDQKLVVIQTPDGVPYDLKVTANIRIQSRGRSMVLKDLKQEVNKKVSVRLVPERRGDLARSIQING